MGEAASGLGCMLGEEADSCSWHIRHWPVAAGTRNTVVAQVGDVVSDVRTTIGI